MYSEPSTLCTLRTLYSGPSTCITTSRQRVPVCVLLNMPILCIVVGMPVLTIGSMVGGVTGVWALLGISPSSSSAVHDYEVLTTAARSENGVIPGAV